jgi:hypothetical protein
VLAALLIGCDKNTVPQETASSTPPPPKVDDPKTANFVGLTAPKPVTWIEHPPTGSMRAANYTVPGRDGSEAAHIVVFYFGPTQGGTIEDNISRWRSQFQVTDSGNLPEPKIDRFDVDSMAVTLVELAGEWQEMGSASFTPDRVFLMAIVEAPLGRVFIRFTGSTATVEVNRQAFLGMIRNLRTVQNE